MHNETIAHEVLGVLADVVRNRPNEGAWALEAPPVVSLARLPHVDAETRQFARDYLSRP